MIEPAAENKQEKPDDKTYQWYFKPVGQISAIAAAGHFRNWLLTDKNLPSPLLSVSSISIVQRGEWYAIRANLSKVQYRHDFATFGRKYLKESAIKGVFYSNRLEIPTPRPLPGFNTWLGYTVDIKDFLASSWEASFAEYIQPQLV